MAIPWHGIATVDCCVIHALSFQREWTLNSWYAAIQTIFPTQPNPIVDNVEIEKYTNVETVKSSRKIGEKGKRSPGKRWQLHPWLRLPCFEPVQPRCPLLRLPDQPCWKGWSWRRPCSPRTPRETLWPSPTWPLSLSFSLLSQKTHASIDLQEMQMPGNGQNDFNEFGFLRIPFNQSSPNSMRYILGFVVCVRLAC